MQQSVFTAGGQSSTSNLVLSSSSCYNSTGSHQSADAAPLIHAHFQKYLQLQQAPLYLSQGSVYHNVQLQQKNSLISNNFHSSDMSLSQSSSEEEGLSRGDEYQQFAASISSQGSQKLGMPTSGQKQELVSSGPSFFDNIIGSYREKKLRHQEKLEKENFKPADANQRAGMILIPHDTSYNASQASQQSSYEALNSISNISRSQRASEMTEQDKEYIRQHNSTHKHLRFDSQQLSSSQSSHNGPAAPNYCEILQLASPSLSSNYQSNQSQPGAAPPHHLNNQSIGQHYQEFIA